MFLSTSGDAAANPSNFFVYSCCAASAWTSHVTYLSTICRRTKACSSPSPVFARTDNPFAASFLVRGNSTRSYKAENKKFTPHLTLSHTATYKADSALFLHLRLQCAHTIIVQCRLLVHRPNLRKGLFRRR